MSGRIASTARRLFAARPNTMPPALNASRALALILVLTLALSAVLPAFPAPGLAGESVDVPLLDRMPDGKRIGYWVAVGVAGGTPAPVLLDTGSKGLMIMASRLGNAPIKRTGRRMKQVYLDGTTFEGEIVRAQITLGKVTTPEPVFILAVNKASCAKDRPDCPARMFGDKGPAGIMGVGLGNSGTLDNPLGYLPPALSEGFIIRGHGPGGRAFLTLGLTPANRSGFSLFPMGRNKLTVSWQNAFFASNALPACVTFEGPGAKPLCDRFLLDSGSSASIISVSSNPVGTGSNGMMPDGKRVKVAFEGMPAVSLTSGNTPWGDAFKFTQGGKNHHILGGSFFTLFDVLYDLKGSAIGLRPVR